MQFALLGPFGLRASIESLIHSLLHTTPTHAPDGGCSHAKGLLNLLVWPMGSLLTLIGFQQDMSMHDFAGRGLSATHHSLDLLTLLCVQLYMVLFHVGLLLQCFLGSSRRIPLFSPSFQMNCDSPLVAYCIRKCLRP